MRLREEHGARPEVVAADLRRLERLGHPHVGVADDGQILPPGLERRQRSLGDQLEVLSDAGRRPQVLRGAPVVGARRAVHRLDADEACPARRGGAAALPESAKRGLHRVEVGKRDGRAHSLKESAPRKCLAREDLHCVSLPTVGYRCPLVPAAAVASARLLRNALLFTTPRMNDETL